MSATTIAAASLAVSANANNSARAARKESCENLLASFDAKYATVEQQQAYAECVDIVHPMDVDVDIAKDGAQVFIFISLALIFAGVITVKRTVEFPEIEDYVFGVIMFYILGLAAIVCISFVYWAFS